jgi:type IV secretory pathway TrbF-like protein
VRLPWNKRDRGPSHILTIAPTRSGKGVDAVEPARDQAVPGPYARRYDIAREGYEMRVAQLARALDQATLKNYLSAGVNAVLAIGIITIALRGGVRPIFIPYDQFGRVIRTEELSRYRDPPRRFIDAELAEWIINVRRIYYGDPVAQLDMGRAAKALLAPEAEQWLDQYFAAPGRNPIELLKTTSRTVDGVTMSKDPDRNVWYLQWREVEIRAGSTVESAWQATLKLEFSLPRTEPGIYANAAGIRITSIEWNQVSTGVAEREPRPVVPATVRPESASLVLVAGGTR